MRDVSEIEARLADQGVATLHDPAPESPHLQKLLGHWKRWCAKRPFPSRQDVNPGEIRDLLPALMLLEVVNGGEDFLYRIAGSGVVRLSGIEPTGKRLSALGNASLILRTQAYLQTCLQLRAPVLFLSQNSIVGHCSFARGETLLLPLARKNGSIDHILMGGDILLPEHMGGGSAGLVIGPARIPVGAMP